MSAQSVGLAKLQECLQQ